MPNQINFFHTKYTPYTYNYTTLPIDKTTLI